MSDNKLRILQRLESGEITAEEAMAMISQYSGPATPPPTGTPVARGPNQLDPRQADPRKSQPHHSYNPETRDGHHTPDWIDNMVGWVGNFVEEVTDSVRDTEVVANLSDIVSGTYGHHKKTENFTSAPILQGLSQLELSGKNDIIEIYAYDGDRVQIRCDYDSRRPDGYVQFHDENGHIALWFDEKIMRSVRITCYIPRVQIGHIHAITKNARIQAADITAGEINLTTKNDKIVIESIRCGNLTAITKNEKINAAAIFAENIHLETANDKITVQDLHATHVTLKTTNAGIKTAAIDAVHLVMNTTNAGLKMQNTLPYTGAFWEGERTLEAYTTNGSIKLGIPGGIGFAVEASTNDGKVTSSVPLYESERSSKTYLEGESTDYATTGRRLNVRLGTTNASVKILAV